MQLNKPATAVVTGVLLMTATLAGCGKKSPTATSHPPTSTSPSTGAKQHNPAPRTCPLTGAPRTKGQIIKRPPLAVKIDNVSDAVPQAGVEGADVVVEELVEGGLTRLMAIYQCNKVATVGPIRSLRISDADILALLHGSVLGYSGANPKDLPPVVAHSDAVLISQDSDPQYFYRAGPHLAPHNVYSSTTKILHAGIAKRKSLTAPKPMFNYGALDSSAKKAHSVSITWPAASAQWQWSGNQWLRTQGGAIDNQADGARLTATNVVVMNVNIASTGLHDVLGTPSPDDVTVGSNPAWIFRNGKVIKGTWHRSSITSEWTYTDKKGHPITLAPGRTWVELLPKGRTPSFH